MVSDGKSPFTILLINDEPLVIKSIEGRFIRDGFKLVSCNTAAALKEIISDNSFDFLIITAKINDPNISAEDIIKNFRTLYPKRPVIMICKKNEIESDAVDDLLRYTVDDYITSPIKLDELSMRVRFLLVKAQLYKKNTVPAI